MFALYMFGALSAMATAALFKKFTSRTGPVLPLHGDAAVSRYRACETWVPRWTATSRSCAR